MWCWIGEWRMRNETSVAGYQWSARAWKGGWVSGGNTITITEPAMWRETRRTALGEAGERKREEERTENVEETNWVCQVSRTQEGIQRANDPHIDSGATFILAHGLRMFVSHWPVPLPRWWHILTLLWSVSATHSRSLMLTFSSNHYYSACARHSGCPGVPLPPRW